MYQLNYRRQARNYLARLPLKIKTTIIDRLHQIATDPGLARPDIKILKAREGYRLRIGPYRVIYTLHKKDLVIEVVKIRPRGDIYKG